MKFETVAFGDVCTLIRGISYKSSDYTDVNNKDAELFVNLKCVMPDGFRKDGIKYYKGKHKDSQYIIPGDLLIANTDLTRNREVIGNSILMPDFEGRACFSMDLSKIEITDSTMIDKRFLYYYLKSPQARWFMINHSDGSTVVHLSTKEIPDMEMIIPDLETQKKIIRILSALDEKIELNNEISAMLKNTIKAMFINHTKKIDSYSILGSIAKVSSGKRPNSISGTDTYEVVGANSVMGYTSDYNIDAGVIVTGRVGTLGEIKRYPRETWASDNTIIIDSEYRSFIESYLSMIDFGSYNRGSTQPLITQTDIKNFQVPFSEKICSEFESLTTSLRNKIFANELENEKLASVRDNLLPQLMSGEINLDKATV